MAVLSPLKASSSSFRGPPHCQKAELEEPVVADDEEEEPYVPDDDAVAEEPEEKNEDMLEGWKVGRNCWWPLFGFVWGVHHHSTPLLVFWFGALSGVDRLLFVS